MAPGPAGPGSSPGVAAEPVAWDSWEKRGGGGGLAPGSAAVGAAPGGGGVGTVSTTANVPNQPDVSSATVQFSPTRMMTVHNKDISVAGGTIGNNSATLTRIEQSFGVIPEPSAIVLAALGALGLGLASRRRLHRT